MNVLDSMYVETRTDSRPIRQTQRIYSSPVAIIAVGALAATSAAFGTASAQFELVQPTGSLASYVQPTAKRAPAVASSDELVNTVRAKSGLTWDQFARAFGVSRRSVHNWAAGEKMSAHNLELLGRFAALVGSTPGSTPEAKRSALLAPDPSGQTPMDAFRSMVGKSGVNVNGRVATTAALLGID